MCSLISDITSSGNCILIMFTASLGRIATCRPPGFAPLSWTSSLGCGGLGCCCKGGFCSFSFSACGLIYSGWKEFVTGNSFNLPSLSNLSYSCWSNCVFILRALFSRNLIFNSSGVASGWAFFASIIFLVLALLSETKLSKSFIILSFTSSESCGLWYFWFGSFKSIVVSSTVSVLGCGWELISAALFCALINSFLGIRLYASSLTSLSFIKSIFCCFTLLPSTNILFRSPIVKIFSSFFVVFVPSLVNLSTPIPSGT